MFAKQKSILIKSNILHSDNITPIIRYKKTLFHGSFLSSLILKLQFLMVSRGDTETGV